MHDLLNIVSILFCSFMYVRLWYIVIQSLRKTNGYDSSVDFVFSIIWIVAHIYMFVQLAIYLWLFLMSFKWR